MNESSRRFRATLLTYGGIAFVALLFTLLAWNRRWISDDGLIYVRVVRQILDGNGPTFNILERAEANTSALWPWFVAGLTLILRADPAHVAVFSGIGCTVAGITIAMLATRHWHATRGTRPPLVPGAIVLVIGMYPFWDYASSGLENGFCTLWIGCAWLSLVLLVTSRSARVQYLAAFVLGLGALARPDLALVTAVFAVAGWLAIRPTRRRTLALIATMVALPVAFEIFRAGYYGTLVPLPALAKSASHSQWERGLMYLFDTVRPHWLVVPLAALAALGLYAARRAPASRTDRTLVIAPLVAGALLGIYILRVGGDFMHARMWLSPLFIIALPAALVPMRVPTAVPLGIIWLWAAIMRPYRNDHKNHAISPVVSDERYGYTRWTQTWKPIDAKPFLRALHSTPFVVDDAVRNHTRLFITESGARYSLAADVPESIVYVAGRLGCGGAATPLDGFVADTLGLSNPLGARITMTFPSEGPGHQKSIPWSWLFADFAEPATDLTQGGSFREIRAARRAMKCGALAEMLASVRAPLTPSRFWKNLVGSIGRTRLVIPSNPFDAEREFCGTSSPPVAAFAASSSHEGDGWSLGQAADGGARGWSTVHGRADDHEEWIELAVAFPQRISGVTLYPRQDDGHVGDGFPRSLEIDVRTDGAWTPVAHADIAQATAPQTYSWPPIVTSQVRIRAPHLRTVGSDGYVLQLAEIELIP